MAALVEDSMSFELVIIHLLEAAVMECGDGNSRVTTKSGMSMRLNVHPWLNSQFHWVPTLDPTVWFLDPTVTGWVTGAEREVSERHPPSAIRSAFCCRDKEQGTRSIMTERPSPSWGANLPPQDFVSADDGRKMITCRRVLGMQHHFTLSSC
jgi:hypothetical protein